MTIKRVGGRRIAKKFLETRGFTPLNEEDAKDTMIVMIEALENDIRALRYERFQQRPFHERFLRWVRGA